MTRLNFDQMLDCKTVEQLIANTDRPESWVASYGQEFSTAATVIAMRQIDRASVRIELGGLAIAVAGVVIAILTLVFG